MKGNVKIRISIAFDILVQIHRKSLVEKETVNIQEIFGRKCNKIYFDGIYSSVFFLYLQYVPEHSECRNLLKIQTVLS